MSEASTSIETRAAVVKRLRDVICLAPEVTRLNIPVNIGFTSELILGPTVTITGALDGDVEIPVLKSGRKVRNDDFPIEVYVMDFLEGVSDGEAVFDSCACIAGSIESWLADDVHVQSQGSFDSIVGLRSLTVGSVDGPRTWRTDVGAGGGARFEINVEIRMV